MAKNRAALPLPAAEAEAAPEEAEAGAMVEAVMGPAPRPARPAVGLEATEVAEDWAAREAVGSA